MNARDTLLDLFLYAGLSSQSEFETVLDAYRVEVLTEAIAAVENREQRRAAHGGDVFGWESACAVLDRLRRVATKTKEE